MAAPALISYTETTWSGTGSKSTAAVTWQSGDLVVVLAVDELGTTAVAAPTAAGLVFTAGAAAGADSSHCWADSWSATPAAGGSQAVTSTGAGADDWGLAVWVWRGSGGIGNRATSTTSAKTVSLIRSGASSCVVFASGDFAAAATTGYSFTPAVANDRQHVQDAALYSVYVADFGDQGAAGTTSYGTSGETSAGPFTNLALEILGLAGSVPAAAPQYAPAWFPSAPCVPMGQPFAPWPQYEAGAVAGAAQDILNAAVTVTATAAAALDVVKAAWVLPPQYPPAWFPSAPSAPGGDPFTAWPLGQTGVNSASLAAASVITAAGAAAFTESKPLNAATTITAAGAAAETTAKPLAAAQTVTAAASASLTVVKAGVTPVPQYPAAWFPAAPGVPGGQPFAPWPPWTGAGVSATPVDVLTAAATITSAGAAALTESKPVTAAATVTATVTASLATAKPLNAAATVTAAAVASLSDVAGPAVPAAMAPLYAPAWFPGQPGLPAAEPFAPWPPWTGALVPAGPVFTIGALTAADKAASLLTAGTSASALTAATAPGSTLTATSQRTGGPG